MDAGVGYAWVYFCSLAALGGFLFGYDLGLIAGALLYMEPDLRLTEASEEVIVGMAKLGAVFGTFIGGALMVDVGRKRAIAVTGVFFLLGPLAMALSADAAGLAVGLALQGSLANFAGGVLILIFKPFKVGDVIDAQGFLGSVREITILYTIVDTFDNRRIVIPNGQLSNASLTNLSAYETRRCDMTFGIGYGDDIDKAKAICRRLIEADERALKEPAPVVVVGGLGDSSVDLTVRAWTKSSDLWPFYWDMQERVKKAFDAEGISIPFPQRDVHLYQNG